MNNPMYKPLKKSYSEDINDLVEDCFEKAKGEGSRGGRVIGHTRSGKPIYAKHDHDAHKDFTAKDHHDASHIHSARRTKRLGHNMHSNTKDGGAHNKSAERGMSISEKLDDQKAAMEHAHKQQGLKLKTVKL